MRRLLLPVALLGLAQFVSSAAAADLPLLLEDKFEDGSARWQPTDPGAWTTSAGRDGKAYTLTKQSKYEPPFRSPINITLLKDVMVRDFKLEVDVQSTIKDYDHRDMVLVFGYVDDKHFYYVHFGKKTDDHANQIFIVNQAARVKISTKTTDGTPWTDDWHHLKLERAGSDIRAYFDDMKTPAMTASDKTFPSGRVGIGSFDDTGRFDNFRLLTIDSAVIEIVETYIAHQLMPSTPGGDALHLALASYHKCDFLVTWNCRHLANANKFGHIRRINTMLGLFVPALVTPLELLGGGDDAAAK